jgi:hypothetical protein
MVEERNLDIDMDAYEEAKKQAQVLEYINLSKIVASYFS